MHSCHLSHYNKQRRRGFKNLGHEVEKFSDSKISIEKNQKFTHAVRLLPYKETAL